MKQLIDVMMAVTILLALALLGLLAWIVQPLVIEGLVALGSIAFAAYAVRDYRRYRNRRP